MFTLLIVLVAGKYVITCLYWHHMMSLLLACSASEWKVSTTFIYGYDDWMNYQGAQAARKDMKVPCEIIRVPQVCLSISLCVRALAHKPSYFQTLLIEHYKDVTSKHLLINCREGTLFSSITHQDSTQRSSMHAGDFYPQIMWITKLYLKALLLCRLSSWPFFHLCPIYNTIIIQYRMYYYHSYNSMYDCQYSLYPVSLAAFGIKR